MDQQTIKNMISIVKHSRMAEYNIIAFLFKLVVPPIYIYAIFINMNNWKGDILFFMASMMGLYRFVRWAINSNQNKRLKDLEIEEKELEIKERHNAEEEKRISLLERELSVRITGVPQGQRRRGNNNQNY